MQRKNGELKKGNTLCDFCSKRAVTFVGDRAYCKDHANVKRAGDHNLRTAARDLASSFDK